MKRVILVIVSIISSAVYAQTVIPAGNVFGKWTKSGSPYQITIGDVTVPAGQTLTIDSGVVVQLDLGLNMKVDGTLLVNGTKTDSVKFTSAQPVPASGQWGTIIVAGTATLNYSIIEYGSGNEISKLYGAISALNAATKLSLKNSYIRNNTYGAQLIGAGTILSKTNIFNSTKIGVSIGASAQMDSVLLVNNPTGIADIYNINGDLYVSNTTIQNSNVCGIYINNDGKLTLRKGMITNSGTAIRLNTWVNQIIDSSIITNNSKKGIDESGGPNLTITNSYVTKNESGISHGSGVLNLINCEISNNSNYGIVDDMHTGGKIIVKYSNIQNNGRNGIIFYHDLIVYGSKIVGNLENGIVFRDDYYSGKYSMLIDSCIIGKNSFTGIFSTVNCSVRIRRTLVYNNGLVGLNTIPDNSLIENNTILGNTGGIENIVSNSNVIIRNNIIVNNSGTGLSLKVAPAPPVKFNLVYANTVNYNGFATSFGNTNLGYVNKKGLVSDPFSNIAFDPQFVDTSALDFHLKLSSPAIASGDTLSPKNNDSTYSDIGAFPFQRNVFSPASLTAVINGGVVDLNWPAAGGPFPPKYYKLYRGMSPVIMTAVDSVKTTSYKDSILYLPINDYYYVTSVDTLGRESMASSVASVVNGISTAGNTVKLNQSWIDIGGKSVVDGSQKFTIEAWIYQTATVAGGHGSRIIDNNREGENDSWTFDIQGNNTLRFNSGPYNGGGGNNTIGKTKIPLNQWHHVAATIDYNVVKLYVDGKLDGQGSVSGYWNGNSLPIRIGAFIGSGLGYSDEYFYGNIDEVRLWNRPLSQREIQSRMFRPLTGFEPGLVGYFTMENTGSGAGQVVANNSSNLPKANDGVTYVNGTLSFVPSTVPTSQIAQLTVNTPVLSFGATKINSIKNIPLVLKALLGGVKVDTIKLLHGVFGVTPSSAGLNPNDTLSLNLSFTPKLYGQYLDTLKITSNGNNPPFRIPVSGFSPVPTAAFVPTTVQFKSPVYGDTLVRIISVKQQTVNPLIVDTFFTRTPYFTATISAKNIPDSGFFTVTFKAPNYGQYADTLFVKNNSADTLITIPLFANIPFPIVFNGATLTFGNVAVSDSIAQLLLLSSANQGQTVFDSIYVKGNQFSVLPRQASIAAKETLRLSITFKPKFFAVFADTVFLVNKAQSTITKIALSGTSPTPVVIPNIPSIAFGNVLKDSLKFRTVSIRNTSINDLTVDSLFSVKSLFTQFSRSFTHPVRRGDTLVVSVGIVPSVLGTLSDTLVIRTNSLNGDTKIPLTATSVLTSVSSDGQIVPKDFALLQNYPNPWNPTTSISYDLAKTGMTTLAVYNTLGQEVAMLVNALQGPGRYTVVMNGAHLSSGMYLYKLNSGTFMQTKRMMLIK